MLFWVLPSEFLPGSGISPFEDLGSRLSPDLQQEQDYELLLGLDPRNTGQITAYLPEYPVGTAELSLGELKSRFVERTEARRQ